MKFQRVFAGILLISAPSVLLAQQGDPIEAAKAVDACNGQQVTSASWQSSGQLFVVCPKGSGTSAANQGGATNFAVPALLGLLAAGATLGGGSSTNSTSGTN
jgi:hypothetical protein